MKKILLVSSLAALIFALAPLSASAITISPPIIEFDARPGDTIVDTIKLYNETTETKILNGAVQTFKALNETGAPSFLSPEESTDLATWLKLDEATITLASEERRDILFSINVPADTEPGGQFAGILWTPTGTTTLEGSGVGVTVKTGTLILVRVAGEISETGRLIGFTADRASYNYLPANFTVRFENLGSIHVKPKGFVSITDSFDKKLVDIPFPRHNIFPGKARVVETSWDKKYLFGKYTATLVGSYGLGNTPFTAFTTFWVVPWKFIGGSAAGLIIIVWALWKIRRRLKLALRMLIKGR